MINILNSNQFKRLYETEIKVLPKYTLEVSAINTETFEKVTEVFVVRDRVIFPEMLEELPFVLLNYEYNNNYLARLVTLRNVVQNVIDRIRNDYTPVTY
jgi:hypothetical protein